MVDRAKTYIINIGEKLKTSSDDELKMMSQVERVCEVIRDAAK